MAGPWFTVQESGGGWQPLGEMWLSDGTSDVPARVELLIALEGANEVVTR